MIISTIMDSIMLHFRQTSPRAKTVWLCLLVISTAITIGGCSSETFKKMAYTLGTSYSCVQSNNHLPNESVKDLKCANPVMSKEMSFEEYQKQRRQLLRQQD